MVEKIVGEDVYFDNVAYQGAVMARAIFSNGSSTNLGLDNGIILCTGNPNFIPGPNTYCLKSYIYGLPGHPLLSSIDPTGDTGDASVLEFDFIPETDSIHFTYVFGSEQYSDFNFITESDVFGCFISGPNPLGGNYNNKNIAIVPGTSDVTIQTYNINNGLIGCGNIPYGPCNYCEYYWDNTNGVTLEYDGFTVVLEATIEVIPCETYHVLIGVADGNPVVRDFDSAVFIEANDYKSPQMELTLNSFSTDTIINLLEGCDEAEIKFKLPDSDFSPIAIYFDFSESTANPHAYPAGDFNIEIPDEIIIEQGEDSVTVIISPAKDGLVEGNETLKIIIDYTLTCNPKYDTIELIIGDYIDMSTQTCPNTTTCQGEEIELWVNVQNGSPNYSYKWEGLPFTNDTITVNPNTSTWYYVDVIDNCQDTVTDSIYVEVITAPEVSLGADTTICIGDQITLQSTMGNISNYLWSTGDTTSAITIDDAGTYSLIVFNECGQTEDEIVIDQWSYPDPNLGPDLELCFGETAFLEADPGFVSYTWQDNSTNDFYTVVQSGLYIVSVEDIHGCVGMDSVLAFVGSIVQLAGSTTLCAGSAATITTNSNFDNYSWSTGQTGIDSIVVSEPGWYAVNVSYDFGCPSTDSTFVEEIPVPEAAIFGDDFLCDGDTLWLTAPTGKYEYFWNDELGSAEYVVTSGGTVTLKLANACGEDEDSKVVQLSSLPKVDLGEDKLLFPGESITLDAGNFHSFIWNNDPGQTGQYYTISYEDIQDQDSIWVEVFDGFCKNSDDIIIEVFSVEVPNVITPNGDGSNDRFLPGEGWNGISKHTIMVFNRWGEKVWESSNFSSGWDGKNNGQLVSSGTYFWILEIWYGNRDIKKVYKGSLTVLGSEN
ncbi:MAG TPA: choice-of-anchor L domain-containing protein [Bacteroidales bacterium]|nr:choice-of-anchor L domain-containing protein [Bacteroidales bacterium]HRX95852.1 choice-of-anchor L domain-containing protein [Bacteroidales bacterium]